MSCAVCAIADLRDDPNTLAATRAPQVLQIALADEALFDQDADLGESALGDKIGEEDGLVGHRSLGEGERPLAQPVVGAGDADGGNLEALFDRLAHRHAVVGDVGTEHHQAALVDEFAVRVDHRLHRTLGQALDLAVDHLHRPIHQALLDGFGEDEVEGLGEGGEQVLRKARRQREVHQVADLDRLSGALVGHLTSLGVDLIFVQTLAAAFSTVNQRGPSPGRRRSSR